MITQQDIDDASIDGDLRPLLTDLLALNADLLARVVALEKALAAAADITAMTAESPDGQGGVKVARYEKV